MKLTEMRREGVEWVQVAPN